MVVECSEANEVEHQEKLGGLMCNLVQIAHAALSVGTIADSSMLAIPTITKFVEQELLIIWAKRERGVFRANEQFGFFLGGN
jgi:hypothetical protein